ncbi:MAG: calcium/sodium antiporter [Planctomycetota bacterium]|nr:MAG: calcium/sodium antiporter [Planctomycetota bacterium]
MNVTWACLLLFGGLVILWKSADWLVDGAVGLAQRLGVSPLVIGLTIVAMGTSAPEVAASIAAAVKGVGNVAIGNVYGSNIANLALVGGLAALIRPIRIQLRTLMREMPVMIVVALLLWPVLVNNYLSRAEGFVLLGIFAGLILLTIYTARKEAEDTQSEAASGKREVKRSVLYVVIGLAGLALGADMVVRGAVFIGERVGLSKAVIGLTIVAIGTSLPELVTCVVAAIRGQHDISIGNLVGSNVFNTLLVVGTAGVVRPFGDIAARLAGGVDYGIMIVVSGVFVLVAAIGRRIGRAKGTMLLLGYIGYMVYLLAYTAGV